MLTRGISDGATRSIYTGMNSSDLVATVTELTAVTIAKGFLHPLPAAARGLVSAGLSEVVVAGGGAKNPYLMDRLRAALETEFGRSIKVCRMLFLVSFFYMYS